MDTKKATNDYEAALKAYKQACLKIKKNTGESIKRAAISLA